MGRGLGGSEIILKWIERDAVWWVLTDVNHKAKEITLVSHNSTADANSAINQSEFEANICNRRKARENACMPVNFDFVLLLID